MAAPKPESNPDGFAPRGKLYSVPELKDRGWRKNAIDRLSEAPDRYRQNPSREWGPRRPPTRDQVRRALAKTIRSLRLKAGISQERLALDVDRDRGNTASLERGLHIPTLETIYELLPGLHVTFAEFAEEFERILRAQNNPDGPTTVPKPKRTRHDGR
jgi:ribosome-binding protein aMBF1 (putative translation factor)